MTDVAVVFDAASNLGYQVLIKLVECYKGRIYFTTEDKLAGYKILDDLKKDGIELFYYQVDVTNVNSIINFRHTLQDLEIGIDLIINNTDHKPKDKKISSTERVRRILNVNFYGNINLGKLIFPLLNENGRVVNVSGPAGLLMTIPDEELRKRISKPNIDEDELVALMQEYEFAVQSGMETIKGWGTNAYAISKVALNALTFLQQREWSHKEIVINCVNPGHLTRKDDRRSSRVFEEGAKAILYLALEAPLHIKGNFVWSNYSVIEWDCDPFVEVTRV